MDRDEQKLAETIVMELAKFTEKNDLSFCPSQPPLPCKGCEPNPDAVQLVAEILHKSAKLNQ